MGKLLTIRVRMSNVRSLHHTIWFEIVIPIWKKRRFWQELSVPETFICTCLLVNFNETIKLNTLRSPNCSPWEIRKHVVIWFDHLNKRFGEFLILASFLPSLEPLGPSKYIAVSENVLLHRISMHDKIWVATANL